MTNRPIPRRGLLGCWFLDDRGITYDAGANEAIDRSGQGINVTYLNGVTVGVGGDPSREFGAADIDDASSQFMRVKDISLLNGAQAYVVIFNADDLDNNGKLYVNANQTVRLNNQDAICEFGSTRLRTDITTGKNYTLVYFVGPQNQSLYINGSLRDAGTQSPSISSGETDLQFGGGFDGRISAVARYDLTVPNAPEPSEIARRWDRLTDIPATR